MELGEANKKLKLIKVNASVAQGNIKMLQDAEAQLIPFTETQMKELEGAIHVIAEAIKALANEIELAFPREG